MINKFKLEEFYKKDEEIRIEPEDGNYRDMYRCISEVFNLNNINSFVDLGCATGHLIKNIKINHPKIDVCGIEYFSYHKESNECSDLIRNNIIIKDLRDELSINTKYDIVYSTEVAEHIDPLYSDNYMKNILNYAKDIVIMSWSAGKVYSQHFNPLEYDEYLYYVNKFGLVKNEILTNKLLNSIKKKKYIYPWYAASITIFNINKDNNNYIVKNTRPLINIEYNLIGKICGTFISDNKYYSGDIKIYLKQAIFDAIFNHNFNNFTCKLTIKIEIKNKENLDDNFPCIKFNNQKFKFEKKLKQENKYESELNIKFNSNINKQSIDFIMPSYIQYIILDYSLYMIDNNIKNVFHI